MTSTTAFVFPGQGSQSVGMLGELAEHTGVVAETFTEASDALGRDLWDLVRNGPEDALNSTDITQPAMLAAGVAVWRALQERGAPAPAYFAGHSLGEYSALVCGGALAFPDAVALVAERGRLMQEAVPQGQGAMAAILGLDDEQVRQVCADAAQGDVVEAVNFNAPGQVVIAGSAGAVERAVAGAKEAGAKRAMPLPVSVPSHCALMEPAAEKLAQRLRDVAVQAPTIPVVHNVDVATCDDPDGIRDRLVRQLHRPVRWVETVQFLAGQGVGTLVECGPGKVLAGLTRRIDKSLDAVAVFDPDSLNKALDQG
ncbi:ACP S-malonyltransferase [Aquisalimonas asiatica]|uniref:Malonyl CoA-acyl carrier protein transacylase n=1 Tax=Aquisalimonas asiatica TaxID=406100 RepID=A0A1H8QE39_9GAMM|nr:ACP S-malonyltransferase [Aquisalimonas asiatica]SEO52509.1 [acyl-carrier-protein] S-malonyltransferase [Aquisalimonas asiatica]